MDEASDEPLVIAFEGQRRLALGRLHDVEPTVREAMARLGEPVLAFDARTSRPVEIAPTGAPSSPAPSTARPRGRPRLGVAAREMIARKLGEAWGDGRGLDMLGLGYATPYLEDFRPQARRTVAAMPAAQGVEVWPTEGRVLSCLAEETTLPFPNALFDRVLVIHALEESDEPLALLREVWRVLAPSGRVIVAAANRRGLWSEAQSTPFGHGRPFTRRQLEQMVREAELEPAAWSRALYAPPIPWLSG